VVLFRRLLVRRHNTDQKSIQAVTVKKKATRAPIATIVGVRTADWPAANRRPTQCSYHSKSTDSSHSSDSSDRADSGDGSGDSCNFSSSIDSIDGIDSSYSIDGSDGSDGSNSGDGGDA
jgi:hypothetical protein